MFSSWFDSVTTGSAVAAVGEAWVGVKEAAGGLKEAASGLTQKMSSLDGVAATLQQALLLDEPRAPPVLPPWDDVGPEADALPDASRLALRSQLMRLAKNKRNFVEGLPEGQEFEFRMEDHLHVAEAAVAADPQLRSIRFHLVPQYVSEIEFWRNYFWRIRLIRQAHGLPALFPLPPTSPPPATSSSSPSSTAAGEGRTNGGASATTASGSPGQPSNDYDDSDDEAAFLAELEALEKEHTSSLVVASPALPPALPLLAMSVTSATATAPDTGDAIRNNSGDDGSSGVVAAEGVPAPVAGAGVDAGASEEYSLETGDDDDEEWEKELELELQAELGGLDSS